MPASPLDELLRSLRSLDYTREKMERLYLAQSISLRDLHSVYEALFLRAVTSFETFLEDLFVSILRGKTRYPRGRAKGPVAIRMKPNSSQALQEILLQGRDYLKWMPFSNTENRANIYLKDGRPFSELDDKEDDRDKEYLRTITAIRNAIAHRSAYAINVFSKKVVGNTPLLPGQRHPAGYLRFQVTPTRKMFEVYAIELGRIAAKLS